MLTPAHHVLSAGATACLIAKHDINLVSGRDTAVAVENGISLFTNGVASDPDKANQETGMQFHAATGGVCVEAQGNSVALMADKAVNVASTSQAVIAQAPKHVLLAAGPSSVRISTAGIVITTVGPAVFRGAVKELTSPGGESKSPKPSSLTPLADCGRAVQGSASSQAGAIALH